MLQKFNLSFILRLLSFSMLFYIPGLYIPVILPVFVLPLITFCIIILSVLFEKMHLRLFPSLLISIVLVFVMFFLLQSVFSALHTTKSDSVFLHIGLSMWIFFLVFLFSFISSLFYLRSEKWKVFEPLLLILIICLLFWSQSNHTLTLFSHPIKATIYILVFISIQLIQALLLSRNTSHSLCSFFLFLPVLLICVYFISQTYNALSVSTNGGLIQPTLFRFDFSPFLSLQNEIKLNDKLVLIVHTKQENTNNMLRRVYLSGWNERKGFFEENAPGEDPQIKQVPSKYTTLTHFPFKLRSPAEQEFFIVNFDPSALIAMDYPVSITPYRIWNSTAFNGAYLVTSQSTGFMPFELYDSKAPTGEITEGLSADGLSFYTKIDTENKKLITPLAESLIENIPGYYDRVLALTSYLRDGDYRYSLKPGIAPNGNQLTYFLFETKKGYCTYFAFSLCLMLRSVGIPARVAAGFFIQSDSGALDYYPVRANMAHAWVEVFFPQYGWVSFDPTTSKFAEGEDHLFSTNPGGDEFIQLLNEIIDKRNLLMPDSETESDLSSSNALLRFLSSYILNARNTLFMCIIIALCLIPVSRVAYSAYVIHYSKNNRKVILMISKKMYRLLRRKGKKMQPSQSRQDFIDSLHDDDLSFLFALEQKARYAPVCNREDTLNAKDIIKALLKRYSPHFYFFCLFVLLSASISPAQLSAQTIPDSSVTIETSDLLVSQAQEAITVENWEAVISILSDGIRLYPSNPVFHFMLGDLYYSKSLFAPAYKEFTRANTLGYTNNEIYSRLADSASSLNLDEKALDYLKIFLQTSPDDLFSWSNYGWLCYKTHRLDEGITSLLKVTETYGPDSNIYVGLGNLYTASFDYLKAKKFYTLAIKLAEEKAQPYLSSIYYYNRSILEEVFYNFDDAYKDTTKSLSSSARSSGYLMQGELELRRLNYQGAFTQYISAFSLDSTPLATIGLADTLLQAGYPEEAGRYISALQSKTDLSWIANYGTTIDQYTADLHKIQKDFYRLKLNMEKRKVVHNLSTYISRLWNICTFSLYKWYHSSYYRVQNKNVAQSYETTMKDPQSISGQNLYINSFYYLAFDKWKKIASPYLSRAENIEKSYVKAAEPSYFYEQAVLNKNKNLFDKAIRSLDPVWERHYQAEALAERILLTNDNESHLKQEYLEKLFSLSPASFSFYDLNLPVSFFLQDSRIKQNRNDMAKIRKLLLQTGFMANPQSSYQLNIESTDTFIRVSLENINNNHTLYTQDIPSLKVNNQKRTEFINSFSTKVFRTDLGI